MNLKELTDQLKSLLQQVKETVINTSAPEANNALITDLSKRMNNATSRSSITPKTVVDNRQTSAAYKKNTYNQHKETTTEPIEIAATTDNNKCTISFSRTPPLYVRDLVQITSVDIESYHKNLIENLRKQFPSL